MWMVFASWRRRMVAHGVGQPFYGLLTSCSSSAQSWTVRSSKYVVVSVARRRRQAAGKRKGTRLNDTAAGSRKRRL